MDHETIINLAVGFARSGARRLDDPSATRKTNARRYIDYYDGDQDKNEDGFLTPKPSESVDAFIKRPHGWINITKDIIKRVSRIYDRRPRRSLDGSKLSPGCAEAIESFWAREKTLLKDQFTDRMTRLGGSVAQRICYIDDRLDVQLFYPDQADVVPHEMDPSRAVATVLETTHRAGDTREIVFRYVYTDEEIRLYRDGTEVDWSDDADWGRKNPYGVAPVVWFTDEHPTKGFWPKGWGESVTSMNREINRMVADLMHWVQMQCFSVPVYTNCAPTDSKTGVGCGKPLIVNVNDMDPRAGFKFETPAANISGALAVLNMTMDAAYFTHGLSASPMRLQIASSGIALAIQRVDLLDDWRSRQSSWTEFERDRAYRLACVWCAENGEALPKRDDIEFTINWGEPRLPMDTDAQMRWQSFLLNNDLTTGPDVIRTNDPDLTEKESKERYKYNQEFNRANRHAPDMNGTADEMTTGLDDPLAAFDEAVE